VAALRTDVASCFGLFDAGLVFRGRYRGTATLLPDGTVLLAGSHRYGGESSRASAEFYDPVTGAFTLRGAMTIPRSNHTATLLNNGRVLIAGGSNLGLPASVGDLYNPGVLVPAPRLFSVSGDGREQGERRLRQLLGLRAGIAGL
jgi:hypothetical protein